MFDFIKILVCKLKGHDWESYSYSWGIHEDIIEHCLKCKRCGQYKEV